MRRMFIMRSETQRDAVAELLKGWRARSTTERPLVVVIDTDFNPKRSNEQNAKFHALCADLGRSGLQWAGKTRNAVEWKVLLVSGHAHATKEGAEMVPGVEGEFVNLRESTARMTKARASSLIEYTLAFMAGNGVHITHDD